MFRTGPKDILVETYGLPFSGSKFYRAAYQSYFRVASALLCKTSFVQYTRPRRAARDTLSLACSWV